MYTSKTYKACDVNNEIIITGHPVVKDFIVVGRIS